MTTPYDDGPQWTGDMLDRPEMVTAFSAQLRGALAEYADYITRIRRDAEAMWDANPIEEYGTFESWWRSRWVKGPLAAIQEHLDAAVKETFNLEARYRRGRHEIPERKAQARTARTQAKALPAGGDRGPALGSGQFGHRTPQQQARQTRPGSGGPAAGRGPDQGESFMDTVKRSAS